MSKLFKFLGYGNKGPTVKPENPGKTLWNLVKDEDINEDEDDVVKKVENFFKTYSNTYISVVNWANPDDNDSTPLYLTATKESYNPVVTQMLISKRADVNKANRNGETPLYRATADGLSDVVTLLISNGATVNKTTLDGHTPLDIARKKRYYYETKDKHKYELYKSIVEELKKLKTQQDKEVADLKLVEHLKKARQELNFLQRQNITFGGSKNLKKTKRRPHNKKRKSVKKKTN